MGAACELTFMSSAFLMCSQWKARIPSKMITLAPYIDTVLVSRLQQVFVNFDLHRVGKYALTLTSGPNFVILGLRTLQMLQACYEIMHKNQKAETYSPFTIVEKIFFTCKKINYKNDEVRVGCPKLGHTILHNAQNYMVAHYNLFSIQGKVLFEFDPVIRFPTWPLSSRIIGFFNMISLNPVFRIRIFLYFDMDPDPFGGITGPKIPNF